MVTHEIRAEYITMKSKLLRRGLSSLEASVQAKRNILDIKQNELNQTRSNRAKGVIQTIFTGANDLLTIGSITSQLDALIVEDVIEYNRRGY